MHQQRDDFNKQNDSLGVRG
ncbi:hypothetical protein ACNKHM_17880 [Shigella sonnei]